MLWLLLALGLVATVVVVRDLLRRPDPAALPDPLRPPPRGGDHTDWACTRAGPDGATRSAVHGGERA